VTSPTKTSKIAAASKSAPYIGKVKLASRAKKGERNATRKAKLIVLSSKSDKDSTEGSLIPKGMKVMGITLDRRNLVLKVAVDGQSKFHSIPVLELSFGDKKTLASVCTDSGFYSLAERAKLKRLADELLQRAANTKVFVLGNSGLHEIEIDGQVHRAYVWGTKAYWFGAQPSVKVVVANYHTNATASCTLEEWSENVGKYLEGNPYMIFMFCHSLSGILRRAFNQPRPSVAQIGKSSIGKSSTQQVCQSATGPVGDVISMSGTKAGIIEHLLNHPDCPVCFQDIRQNDKVDNLIDLIFDSADGAGRMRFSEDLKKIAATMILSNERLLVDMVRGKTVQIEEGIYARYFELVCCAPHGAFHNLHEFDDAAEFADNLKEKCERNFGAVWPALLRALSKDWSLVEKLYKEQLPKVKSAIAKRSGDGNYGRVTNRIMDALSFSAWVGVLACRFKVLPIKSVEIIDSFGLVMKEHVARQSSGSTPLVEELVHDVRGCLDEGSSRFPPLPAFSDENHRSSLYGYRWNAKKHGDLFLFLPHVFDRLFKEKYGGVVYGMLEESGFLVKTTGQGNQYQVRIPKLEKKKSFIAIKACIQFDPES
jgi:hypothetical protein